MCQAYKKYCCGTIVQWWWYYDTLILYSKCPKNTLAQWYVKIIYHSKCYYVPCFISKYREIIVIENGYCGTMVQWWWYYDTLILYSKCPKNTLAQWYVKIIYHSKCYYVPCFISKYREIIVIENGYCGTMVQWWWYYGTLIFTMVVQLMFGIFMIFQM